MPDNTLSDENLADQLGFGWQKMNCTSLIENFIKKEPAVKPVRNDL